MKLNLLENRILFDASLGVDALSQVVDGQDDQEAVDEPRSLDSTDANDDPFAALAEGESSAVAKTEIAIVDTGINGYEQIVSSLPEGIEVILIDGDEDGFLQLGLALDGRSDIDAIHFFGHGRVGEVHIGSSVLNSDSIAAYSDELMSLGSVLSEDGDLLFYGCDVAADDSGQALVIGIANLTSADVTASVDTTGNLSEGADWELEYAVGSIETATAFESGEVDGFQGLLAVATISDAAFQTINEGGSLSFNGLFTVGGGDADSIGEIVFVSGSGELRDGSNNVVEAGGSLSQIGDAAAIQSYLKGLTYTPATDSNETATFVLRVDENSGEQSADNSAWDDFTTLTVNITAVPDRPTLDGNATLPAVNEDSDPAGATVSSLFGDKFADVDGDTFAGIAIRADASTGSQGAWEYSFDGTTWTAVGSVASNNALLLDASTLLRFNPADNYNGTPGSLTVRAIDSSTSQTFTSAGSRTFATSLTGTDTSAVDRFLQTSILPVNDAPTTSAFSLTVDKNVTLTAINLTANAADVDGIGDIESYSVTVLPDAGTGVLQLSNGTAVTAGTTLSIAQASTLQFVPVTNYTGPATFSYTASDGETTSNASVVTITVAAFNEPPGVTVPDGPLSVAEDAAAGLTITGISVSDLDAGSSIVEVTVSTAQAGTITLSGTTGLSF